MPSNMTVATAIKHKTEAYQLHFRPFNMTDTKSTIQNEQRATQQPQEITTKFQQFVACYI